MYIKHLRHAVYMHMHMHMNICFINYVKKNHLNLMAGNEFLIKFIAIETIASVYYFLI